MFSVSCGDNHNVVIGTPRDSNASNFQIYSSDNALFTSIDKNKTLVYVWGDNTHSQLGLDNSVNTTVVGTPTLLEAVLDFNFTKSACGSAHTVLLEQYGNLLAFGDNQCGQVGYSVSMG